LDMTDISRRDHIDSPGSITSREIGCVKNGLGEQARPEPNV
jgi:hypothetical protein